MGYFARILLFLIILFPKLVFAEAFVGTQNLETKINGVRVPIRLFYPTIEEETVNHFGPWEIKIAKNAPIRKGKHPIIFIAHGNGGNSWVHRDLAIVLAKNGFIVAAPHFKKDRRRDHKPELFFKRTEEFIGTINFILTSPELRSHIHQDRMGAFGFSLGGYTVLSASGGIFELSRAWEYCETTKDAEFCGTRKPKPLKNKLKHPFDYQGQTERPFQAMVLAAPLGIVFSDLNAINIPTLIYRIENDQQLKYPNHAKHIHKLIKISHVYRVLENAHHFAFLSPFPQALKKEVGEPAIDPQGFERDAFLKKTNQEIVDFFNSQFLSTQ